MCFLKNSQNSFTKSLLFYLSSLLPMIVNDNIADIKNAHRICSPNFVADKVSELFLLPSIFSIKYSRSTKITSDALSNF